MEFSQATNSNKNSVNSDPSHRVYNAGKFNQPGLSGQPQGNIGFKKSPLAYQFSKPL